uniref:MarR family winged helix-turn-helix transcriptional regulator n=2 Tax=Lachnospiraceae TaxID=186803 RepID=UPI001D080075
SSHIRYMDMIQELQKQKVHVRVSDLSDVLNIPRPGVTRTIKEMEKKGLVQKISSPDDGRVTYLSLTEHG